MLNCGVWPSNPSGDFARNVGSQVHPGLTEYAFYDKIPRILKLPADIKALGMQTTLSRKGEDPVHVSQEMPYSFFLQTFLKGEKSDQLKFSKLARVITAP